MRRTKEEAARTRLSILDAARRQFASHGVTRTTMQRIASAAGVTRGAVYWHFNDKRELFRAMREQVSLPLFDQTEMLGPATSDPLLAIEQYLYYTMDAVAKDAQTRRTFDILALKCEYVDELRPELKRHMRRCGELRDKFAALYTSARRAGLLRTDVAPDSAALSTCVFLTGLLRLWLMDAEGSILRGHARALIADHVALMRIPPFAAHRERP